MGPECVLCHVLLGLLGLHLSQLTVSRDVSRPFKRAFLVEHRSLSVVKLLSLWQLEDPLVGPLWPPWPYHDVPLVSLHHSPAQRHARRGETGSRTLSALPLGNRVLRCTYIVGRYLLVHRQHPSNTRGDLNLEPGKAVIILRPGHMFTKGMRHWVRYSVLLYTEYKAS